MMIDDTGSFSPEQMTEMGAEVDQRMTDVWSFVFERGVENIDDDFLAWILRLAFISGYWGALSEADRGSLCKTLGYPVPVRGGVL